MPGGSGSPASEEAAHASKHNELKVTMIISVSETGSSFLSGVNVQS